MSESTTQPQATAFYYTDKSSGNELRFTPKTEEAVVSLSDGSTVDAATAL